jgi:hypothetical protein
MAGKKSLFIFLGVAVVIIGVLFLISKNIWHHPKAINNPISIADSLNKVPKNARDTIIVVNINGIEKRLEVDKDHVHWCLDIEKIAKEFRNRRLDTTIIRYLDITGDGINEKIIGHVYITKDSVLSDRTIYRRDAIISFTHNGDCLNDTFNNSDMAGIFNDMSPLEPYASFQEFLPSADIYNDTMHSQRDFRNDTDIKFYMLEDILEERHVPQSKYAAEKEKFRRYVINFKGVLLNSHDEMDAIPEIWYEPGKRFIELY